MAFACINKNAGALALAAADNGYTPQLDDTAELATGVALDQLLL
jgi:hypothetical protein